MNDLERTFRDGLRQAVADRPGGIRVDLDEVIARASAPDFVPETRWTPPRWLAAAAAVLVVAGLGVGVAVLRPSVGVPAVPAAPVATASPSTWFDADKLIGSQWWAMQIDGRSVQKLGATDSPSLTFTSATEVLTNDGCNTSYRSYRLTPHGVVLDLSFGLAGAQTEIGCDPAQQKRFVKALDDTTQAVLSADYLEFLNPDRETVLRFVRADPTATAQPTPGSTNPISVAIGAPSSSATSTRNPVVGDVRVRLYNDTGVTLRDVKVAYPGEQAIQLATMEPGSYSPYATPAVAYRLASLEAKANGHPYRTTPVDYVGEQPLEPGSYTFSIRLVEGVMFMEFGQD